MTELLNCPFCGVHLAQSEGIFGPIWGHPVVPADCPIDGAVIVDADQWNRRATPSPRRPDREAIARIIAERVVGELLEKLPKNRADWRRMISAGTDMAEPGAHQDEIFDAVDQILDLRSPEPSQPPSGGVELEALKAAAVAYAECFGTPEADPEAMAGMAFHLRDAARAYAASVG